MLMIIIHCQEISKKLSTYIEILLLFSILFKFGRTEQYSKVQREFPSKAYFALFSELLGSWCDGWSKLLVCRSALTFPTAVEVARWAVKVGNLQKIYKSYRNSESEVSFTSEPRGFQGGKMMFEQLKLAMVLGICMLMYFCSIVLQ